MKSSTRTITRNAKTSTFRATPERTIEWLGGVNYQSLENILGKIKHLMVESREDEIHLLINSYGGATGVGMSFYDAATSWLRPNITTIGSGDVDSSGIIVFLSGRRRYLTRNTTLLFHMAGRTFNADKRYTVADMEAMLNEDHLKDFQYACVVSDATKGRYTPAMIIDMMRRNTILTAAEAVEMGLAHAII